MDIWFTALHAAFIFWLLHRLYVLDQELARYKEYHGDLHSIVLALRQEVRTLQEEEPENAAAGTD